MAQGRRLLVAGCEKMEGQLFKGFVWMPGTAACTRVRPECQRVDMRRAIESPSQFRYIKSHFMQYIYK